MTKKKLIKSIKVNTHLSVVRLKLSALLLVLSTTIYAAACSPKANKDEGNSTEHYEITAEYVFEDCALEYYSPAGLSSRGLYIIEDSKLVFKPYSNSDKEKVLYSFSEGENPASMKALSDGRLVVDETVSDSESYESRVLYFEDENSEPTIIEVSSGVNNSVARVFLLSDGRMAASLLSSDLVFYSEDGQKVESIKMDEMRPGVVVPTQNGGVLVQCSSAELNEIISYSADYGKRDEYAKDKIFVGGCEAIYYIESDKVYRFEAGAESDTEVFSYTEMGIPGDSVRLFTDDESSFYIGWNEGNDLKVFVLNRTDGSADPGQNSAKEDNRPEIGFAVVNTSTYQGTIVNFNRTSKDFKVSIDYTAQWSTADNNEWIDKYYAYILAEKPELFEVWNYEDLAKTGYMTDILPYLENSSEIDAEDYCDGVLEDNMIGGKLYSIPQTMFLDTLVVPEDALGDKDSWDVWEFLEFLEEHPDAMSYNGKEANAIKQSILLDALLNSIDEFIDQDTLTAKFEEEEFKDFLGKINALNIPVISQSEKERLNQGDLIIANIDIFCVEDFSNFEYESGKNVIILGFPSAVGGTSVSCISYGKRLAVANGCEHPDEAWEFMEYYLNTPPGQYVTGFPTKKADFESVINEETDRSYYIEDVYYGPVTQEEIDKVRGAFERRFIPESNQICWIVCEESESYFSGDKTLDDVCRVIQSRVQLMLNE